MVNRRMKPPQVLTLIRKLARQHGLTIEELPKRGKGSHRIFVLADAEGKEVGRVALTGHARDLSWKVLGSTEDSLAHLRREVDGGKMTSYDVTVTREDNLWVALADNVGAIDVEHFPDLDVEVRDYIAGMTDADSGDFAIHWRYEINGRDITDALTRFMAAERELRDVMAQEAAKAAERDAARLDAIQAVRSAGLSQRVAADVVGLSHQRVHQLVSSTPRRAGGIQPGREPTRAAL